MKTNNAPSQSTELSLRTAAIVAGLGLLAMAVLAGFANISIFQNLVVPGDANATAENILTSAGLFRMDIVFFLLVAILDVFVAWALYILLKPVNKTLSLLAAWFRLVYASIFAIALSNLFISLKFFSGTDYLKVFETNQLNAQGMSAISAFQSGWNIGLVFFGLHLLIIGYMAFKSGYIPKWLGVLLVIAGIGYIVDSFGKFLVLNFNVSISTFTFIGEVLLIFWLLWKAIKGFEYKEKGTL